MNRNLIKSVLIVALLLSSCVPHFPAMQNAYISPINVDIFSTLHFLEIALSPDGQTVTHECGRQIDLETGTESYPFQNYAGSPKYMACFIHHVESWMPNGRYLGVAQNEFDSTTNTIRYRNWIIDTETQTVQIVAGRIFWAWSPFNTGSYLTRNEDSEWVLSVYNLDDQSAPILLDGTHQYDFTQEDEVGGTGYYLWSKRLDLPVAELAPLWSGTAENMRWSNLVIISLFDPAIPGERKYQQTLIDDPAAHIVGAIFDPTGEYVLAAQWECAYTDVSHCSDLKVPPVMDGITDSVLTLIRWRTGESRELFRLSAIDAQNVIASGDLYWSADGSTILIGRIGASFVVLKVK